MRRYITMVLPPSDIAHVASRILNNGMWYAEDCDVYHKSIEKDEFTIAFDVKARSKRLEAYLSVMTERNNVEIIHKIKIDDHIYGRFYFNDIDDGIEVCIVMSGDEWSRVGQ